MKAARNEIVEAVRGVLAEVLHRPADGISLDASLELNLGMDSLTTIEASVALEERFGVAMPDFARPDEAGLDTVLDLVELVARKVAERDAKKGR